MLDECLPNQAFTPEVRHDEICESHDNGSSQCDARHNLTTTQNTDYTAASPENLSSIQDTSGSHENDMNHETPPATHSPEQSMPCVRTVSNQPISENFSTRIEVINRLHPDTESDAQAYKEHRQNSMVEVVPANWLPFDSTIHQSMTYCHNMTEYIDGTATSDSCEETISAGIQNGVSPSFERDKLAALIAAMPGVEYPAMRSKPSGTTYRASLYSDGAGARITEADRRAFERQINNRLPHDETAGHWSQSLRQRAEQESSESVQIFMTDNVYDNIIARTLGNKHFDNQTSFDVDIAIERPVLELFISLYFKNFHIAYPFIDRTLLNIPAWGWALCLATAGIGARYLGKVETTRLGDRLCCMLYELLIEEVRHRF